MLVPGAATTGSPAPRAAVSPARGRSTPVDGVRVLDAISPSRAADFAGCPLRYRLRTIDRIPEEPSPAAARGTLVHQVLEDLFTLPAAERTPQRARSMLAPAWGHLREREPGLAALFAEPDGADTDEAAAWLASCVEALDRWFTLEDPQRLEPAERELYVETVLASGLLLRGFVDRLDVAPDGAIRVVDYKTGRSPREGFEAAALFQMRFYALVLWRTRGVLPSVLQLVYLGDGEILRHVPDEQELLACERRVEALWRAITLARVNRDWRPRRSALCSWCSFRDLCPEFGGTPPPLPVEEDPR